MHFWPNFDFPFPQKLTEIIKNSFLRGETSAIGLVKNVKIKVLSTPPFREKYDYFLHYWGYFWLEIGQCHKLKGQNQNLTCTHNNSWSTSCGKIMVPALSNFANIDHKGYFRKMLTQTFKSGCFSWNHTYVL